MSSSVCWECNKFIAHTPELPAGVCSCGAIQPLPPGQTHFQVLGIEARYDLDPAELEARFREASRQFHPDKHARADAQGKRISLQRITAVNDAYRTLKDPVRRGEYMLRLGGVHVGAEDGTAPKLSPIFLMETLEKREELQAARKRGDHARVRALGEAARRDRDAAIAEMADAVRKGAMQAGGEALVKVRYLDRFLEEVELHEAELEEVST